MRTFFTGTAGVGQPQQLEIAHHVLIEGGHIGERFEEIEDDVRLEVSRRRSDATEVVVDAEHAHFVPHLSQCLDDVVFHLPLGFEDVDAGGVFRWHQMVVHEREDAQLLLLHRNNR